MASFSYLLVDFYLQLYPARQLFSSSILYLAFVTGPPGPQK